MIDLFNAVLAGIAHGLAIPTAWWAFSAWWEMRKFRRQIEAQRAAMARATGMAVSPRSFAPTQQG